MDFLLPRNKMGIYAIKKQAIDLKRHFYKECIQTANEHI